MRRTLAVTAALLLAPAAHADPAAEAAARVTAGTVSPGTPLAPAPEAPAAQPEPALPDQPETGPQGEEIDEQSAELEAIRAAEQDAQVQEAPSLESRAAEAAEGLGLGSPLRLRLEGALSREVAPPPSEARGRVALIPELDHGLEQLQAEYDIPIDVNDAVVSYIRFFQSRQVRPHFVKWLGRSHRYLDRYRQILREEGLPEDTVYLAMIESGFANFAQSRAKAVGPWQFIAPTGKIFGLRQDFWVDERRDPEKSARAAARYLKELKGQTGDWRLSWAGYNAGAGTIFRARAKGYQDFWSMAETKGRKILRAETKGYVPKLMAAAIISKHPEAFGFMPDEIEPERWPDYVEVTLEEAVPLAAVARAAGVPEHVLVDLNPELRRACTPPRRYQLKLPRGAEPAFAAAWPELAPKVRTTFDGHVVQRGETLSGIAARFGVPVQGILEMNPRIKARALRPGTELIIPGARGQAVARSGPPAHAAARAEKATDRAVKTEAARAAAAGRPGTWKVEPGDTLWQISRESGVELKELCRLNGIADPRRHKLQVGQQLQLKGDRG
ncbi:MAG: LysM peptidoglycan-binding domain-containing protein [Anaeromyxobacteraceae bacterium]|nr:LysM peptidoglycan-binding domain-containing protein [Anaeromyxobacteraceae bacterium]